MTPSQSCPVLLVEDTRSLATLYETFLNKAGFDVTCAYTAAEATRCYREAKYRVILLDLMLPDGDGIDVLSEIHATDPQAKVLVITANGSINRAVEAMREGAFDFLVKPFDERRLLGAVENAIAALGDDAERARAPAEAERGTEFQGFIGSSRRMQMVYEMVRSIGRSTATVFITGESGTGKEICARAIHEMSTRRAGPFVPLNCGAIPRDLLESEVFGHLRGSFTGALADKRGAAAVADAGTLFLDEICEMDLGLQTKLLRFIQTSMIQPVGATEPQKVDVRIICATNRDPAAEVRMGRFREDLYYRLHVVPIHLPPLRERGEDVNEIAEVLLRQISTEEGRAFERLSAETRRLFRSYPWPGNVRELQNVLRHVVVLHDAHSVEPEMLPHELRAGVLQPEPVGPSVTQPAAAPGKPEFGSVLAKPAEDIATPESRSEAALHALVGTTLGELERQFIEVTIAECDGSIPKAARLLDVSPSTLYRKREAWSRNG